MLSIPKFSIGSKFHYDDKQYTFVGYADSSALIRSQDGSLDRITLSALLSSPDFKMLNDDSKYKVDPSYFDLLSPELLKEAEEMQEHVREVLTGYRSGISDLALPGEPKPEYRLELPQTQRVIAKAKELRCGKRTIWYRVKSYEDKGLMGLVDVRKLRNVSPAGRLDPRVRQSILDVLSELTDKSNHTKDYIRRLVQIRLNAEYGEGVVGCPKRTAFNKALNELGRGRGYFGSAKGRRSADNRPDTPYRRFNTTRPGEFVLIDSTPLDAFAIDPVSYKWVSLQLTIAFDLFSRSILAWRFTARDASAVDAALLLHDIIKPEPMRPEWDQKVRFDKRYCGIPQELIIEAGFQDAAAIPVVDPETVVVDRGRIFLSQAFRSACEQMGINIHISRPRAPTDKSHIERVFGTIRTSFVQQLPGYKGPDVYSRGAKVEDDAFFFTDEIEDLFAEWVATYWQNRHHEGLNLDGAPKMNVSPNEMYEEGIARAGFVYPAPSQTLYYDLLPTEWRTIQHYGVEVRGLRYDGDCLNYFRNETSPYNGEKKGKWPMRYDPRDLSKIFFYDTQLEEWQILHWVGISNPDTPFAESTVTYAKALLKERGGNTRNHDQLERVLIDLVTRIEDRQLHSKEERRLAARQAIQAAQAAKDRGLYGNNVVPLDSFRNGGIAGPDAPAFGTGYASDVFYSGSDDYEEDLDEDIPEKEMDTKEERRVFPTVDQWEWNPETDF